MKFNKSEIMKRAWVIFKAGRLTTVFAEALKMAWAAVKAKSNKESVIAELALLPETKELVKENFSLVSEAKKALAWAQSKTGKGQDVTISNVLNSFMNFHSKTVMFKAAMQQVNA